MRTETPPGFSRFETTSGDLSLALPADWQLFEIPGSLPATATFFAAANDASATINVVEEPGTKTQEELIARAEKLAESVDESRIEPISLDGQPAIIFLTRSNGIASSQIHVSLAHSTAYISAASTSFDPNLSKILTSARPLGT